MLKLIQANNDLAYLEDNNLNENSLIAVSSLFREKDPRFSNEEGKYELVYFRLTSLELDNVLVDVDGNSYGEFSKYINKYFYSDNERYSEANFDLKILLIKRGY